MSDVFYDLQKKQILPDNIDPIAYTIGFANNIINRYLSSKKLLLYVKDYSNFEQSTWEESEDDREELEISLKSIKQLITKLPNSCHSVLFDTYFTDKSKAEIRRERNYKSFNVYYSKLSQCRKKLMDIIYKSDNHIVLKDVLKRIINKHGKL